MRHEHIFILLLFLTNSAVNGALISVLRLKPTKIDGHRGKFIFISKQLYVEWIIAFQSPSSVNHQ